MATSKELKHLMANPAAMMRHMATGRMPSSVTPDSALIRLLEKISPRDRLEIRQVTVDADLGYTGSVTFGNAEQALRWLKPDSQVFGTFPAETRRIKAFAPAIPFATFVKKCQFVPAHLLEVGAPAVAKKRQP